MPVDEIAAGAAQCRGKRETADLPLQRQSESRIGAGRQRRAERDPDQVAAGQMQLGEPEHARNDDPSPPGESFHHRHGWRPLLFLASSAMPAMVPTRPLVSIGISTSHAFGDWPIWDIASTYFWAMK
jgi:hypothetical protein